MDSHGNEVADADHLDFLDQMMATEMDSPPVQLPTPSEAREAIGHKLEMRPTEADLVERNIMPGAYSAVKSVHPALYANAMRLHRAKVESTVNTKLQIRPTRDEMMQRHLLPDSTHHPSIQEFHKALDMRASRNLLNTHLENRPGPLDLANQRILSLPAGHDIKREPTPSFMENKSPVEGSPQGKEQHDVTMAPPGAAPEPPPLPPTFANVSVSQSTTTGPTTPPIRKPSVYSITSPDGVLRPPAVFVRATYEHANRNTANSTRSYCARAAHFSG